jgi:hypothetical protein
MFYLIRSLRAFFYLLVTTLNELQTGFEFSSLGAMPSNYWAQQFFTAMAWRQRSITQGATRQDGSGVCSAAFNWYCFTRFIHPRICDRFARLKNSKSFNQEWLKSYTYRSYIHYPFSCPLFSSIKLSGDNLLPGFTYKTSAFSLHNVTRRFVWLSE